MKLSSEIESVSERMVEIEDLYSLDGLIPWAESSTDMVALDSRIAS